MFTLTSFTIYIYSFWNGKDVSAAELGDMKLLRLARLDGDVGGLELGDFFGDAEPEGDLS